MWPNPLETAGLVIFTEEILNWKLHFLCNETCLKRHNDTKTNRPCCNFALFVFCMLINKNVLEWFLLIMCKEITLTKSTNLLTRNHPTLCFRLRRESPRTPNTLWLCRESYKEFLGSYFFNQQKCLFRIFPKVTSEIIQKVNESRYMAIFLFSGSITKLFSSNCVNIYFSQYFFSIDFGRWKKVFSIDRVNIYIFLSIFFNRFCPLEKCGVTRIAYIVIH